MDVEHLVAFAWQNCTAELHGQASNATVLPQIAMGAFVNYFFSGFIMGKIPFPLSPSFRLMLQVMSRFKKLAALLGLPHVLHLHTTHQ